MDEWVEGNEKLDKQTAVHAGSGKLLGRKKEEPFLMPARTWMNLRNIMLSKRGQPKRVHNTIPFM